MSDANSDTTKKKRGPVATGKGTPVMLRLQPGLLGKLDDHIADQAEPKPTRPEAIRRLLEQSLIC